MWKIALRGFRASFARFILTLLSVALGVAFLGTTLALKDGLNNQFEMIMNSAMQDDLFIVGKKVADDDSAQPQQSLRQSVPDTMAKEFQDIPGAAYVYPAYTFMPELRDKNGDQLGKMTYAPTILAGQKDDPSYEKYSVSDGRWAHANDELVIEKRIAADKGIHVGDELQLVYETTRKPVTVVGTVDMGSGMAGATLLLMRNQGIADIQRDIRDTAVEKSVRKKMSDNPDLAALPQAMRADITQQAVDDALADVADDPLSIGSINVVVAQGQSVATVQQAIDRRIGQVWKDYELTERPQVLTRQQYVDELNESNAQMFGFVNTFLLIFVGIALFVGTFIISNTFRMIVQAQQRQFAMLRAIGVSVFQVFATVFVQGLLTGVIGSVIGVGLAFALKTGLLKLIQHVGLMLESLPLSTTNIVIAVVVGIAVTMIGALLPARSAAKTPPVEAMRDVEGANQKPLTIPTIIGVVLMVIGGVAMALGAVMKTDHPGVVLGAGVVVFLIGVLVATPALSKPVAWLLAWPFRLAKPIGTLALRNVVRNPRRTAATASALTIGVTLVTLGSVMAASMKANTADIVDEQVLSDMIIASQTNQNISDGLSDEIASVNGVRDVNDNIYSGVLEVVWAHDCPHNTRCRDDATSTSLTVGVTDTAGIGKDYKMPVKEGSLDSFLKQDTPTALVSSAYAKDHNVRVGDTIELIGEKHRQEVTISAVVTTLVIQTPIIITNDTADNVGLVTKYRQTLMVNAEDGQSVDTVRQRIHNMLKEDYPVFAVFTKDEYKDAAADSVNIMLAIIYSLLALSILIAILGIINTQTISVRERIRELGLLRAVGLSRTKISSMVIIESILTSIFGSLLGFLSGIIISKALFTFLVNKEFGIEEYVFPMDSLVMMVVGGIIIGVIAGIGPSIRAAKVPILTAVAHED